MRKIKVHSLPVLPGVLDCIEMGLIPGGAYRNRDTYRDRVSYDQTTNPSFELLLYDPQTSGGLLAAIPPEAVDRFRTRSLGPSIVGQPHRPIQRQGRDPALGSSPPTPRRCCTQQSRPHPPRADGEQDGAAERRCQSGYRPHPTRPDGEGDRPAIPVRPPSRRISFTHATSPWGSEKHVNKNETPRRWSLTDRLG